MLISNSGLSVSESLGPHGLQPTRILCPWRSPGENTGVGGHALLQGIFPTQGWKSGLLKLLHFLADFLPLSPRENPRPQYTQVSFWPASHPAEGAERRALPYAVI